MWDCVLVVGDHVRSHLLFFWDGRVNVMWSLEGWAFQVCLQMDGILSLLAYFVACHLGMVCSREPGLPSMEPTIQTGKSL